MNLIHFFYSRRACFCASFLHTRTRRVGFPVPREVLFYTCRNCMHNQGITIGGIARNEDIDENALALECRERLVMRPHHPSQARAASKSHNSRPPRSNFVHARVNTQNPCVCSEDSDLWPQETSDIRMKTRYHPRRPVSASSAKTTLLSQSSSSSASVAAMEHDIKMHGEFTTFTNDDARFYNLEDIMRVLSPTSDDDESDEDVSESPFQLKTGETCCRDPQWQNDALQYKSRRQLWGDTLPSGEEVTRILLSIERWQQSTHRRSSKSRIIDEDQPSMGDE